MVLRKQLHRQEQGPDIPHAVRLPTVLHFGKCENGNAGAHRQKAEG
jgi:hypothetical protein